MSLTDQETAILDAAGTAASTTLRRQAVAIALSKQGPDRDLAREHLVAGYLVQTQPSFHLIPRGDAMTSEFEFVAAYGVLASGTSDFTNVTVASLRDVLLSVPSSLAPLRMILGLTHNELAVAVELTDAGPKTSGNALKAFERRPAPERLTERQQTARTLLAISIAATAMAVMARQVLAVGPSVAAAFHSKLDKRDTVAGWNSVANDSAGVPYSALLYQRYVGGVWRQVQDAYSEVKGDNLAELPVAKMLQDAGVSFWRTRSGASGATETAARYGLSPGPDFVMPEDNPTVVLESKIGEDGGTVRDKASRIQGMARSATARGLIPCAVVDGKGWRERPSALTDVIIATEGRTYTLNTVHLLLSVPEIAVLMRAPLMDGF